MDKNFSIILKNDFTDANIVNNSIIGNSNYSTNEIVDFFDGGFRKHFVLYNDSNEIFDCGIIAPSGYTFRFAEDGFGNEDGSIELVNLEGNPILAIYQPWAKDSTGKDVKTYYTIEDNRVYQRVLHKGSDYVYPIIADPTAQYNKWFSGTKWVSNTSGWTLSVAPSSTLIKEMNAQKGSMIASVTNTSWNTLYNQHKGSSHWKNTQGMKDQYKCHAFNAQSKSRWNLDTWRPNVGYTQTVLKLCNP